MVSTRPPNEKLAAARLDARLTQEAAAAAVNEYLASRGYERTIERRYISRLEAGAITWPCDEYREALGFVLTGDRDADLGFYNRRARPYATKRARSSRRRAGAHREADLATLNRIRRGRIVTDSLPSDIDLDNPSAARVYDYLLGGTANWAVDRVLADELLKVQPDARTNTHINREFLGRVVRHCVRAGVTQFLDIGSGIPSAGNVHEVADEMDPQSRCVYVDFEPVAVSHSKILLEQHGDPRRHAVVQARMEDVDQVWNQAMDTGILDPDRPIGLIMIALVHFVADPDARRALAQYRGLLPSGSRLALNHTCAEGASDETQQRLDDLIQKTARASTPVKKRSRADIQSFFGDFTMEPPGLVWLPEWNIHAGPSKYTVEFSQDPTTCCIIGGVGVKP